MSKETISREDLIRSVVPDIYRMLETRQIPMSPEWVKEILSKMDGDITEALNKQIFSKTQQKSSTLRMSNLGTPCETRLWKDINTPIDSPLRGSDVMKFLYGDILEALLVMLAGVSGHTIRDQQMEVSVMGVKGHIDGILHGMLIDIKSASDFSYRKFAKGGGLLDDDGFGYLSQLSSYLYALQDYEELKVKDKAGFLVINKVTGEICLDVYDMKTLLENKRDEVMGRISLANQKDEPTFRMPDRPVSGTSPNRQVHFSCGFCPYKKSCFPDLRSFRYSNRTVHLTHVGKVPNVPEIGGPVAVVPGSDDLPVF